MEDYREIPWHHKKIEEIYQALETTEKGLTDAEAEKRLEQYGYNELRQKSARTIWQMLWTQIMDPMIFILIGAALFSIVLNELAEAMVIVAIVILNAIIGIWQEKKAESSLNVLRDMSALQAYVLRAGEQRIIPANELVIGDIVFLEDGSKIPADIRLIESTHLKIQEASLTGESVPSNKKADQNLSIECALGDRVNMAYSSCVVTSGRGIGVVVATGMNTEVGCIASMIENQDTWDTPIKRKLNAVGKSLTIVGIVACLLFVAIGIFYQRPLLPQILVAISLAISVIPEGLPATATIVMALGVQRMVKKNALIRNLPAVETLGGATVICCDKTGTLTLNKMTVHSVAMNEEFELGNMMPVSVAADMGIEVYKELLYASVLCNNASFDADKENEIIGDPTEGALLCMAQTFGMNPEMLKVQYPRYFEQTFDSDRKRMSTIHNIEGKWVVYTKGAVDEMLPLCTQIMTSDGIRSITQMDRANIQKICFLMSIQALRVLGFAMKNIAALPQNEMEDMESGLTFIGVVGMIDPPRKEVAESIRICREAGIRTIMITGDHKATALAIAKELDIWQEGDTAISGDELAHMSADELDAKVQTTTLFARVSPADKMRIIRSLKRTGEVTAMTGDGVNDSPALKAADIGVAMGITGTDVAKEAADMILLDDSFTTIASAIKEGRRVYRNIQKVIQFLLAGNIAEMLTILIAAIFNWDTPLQGIHILWVNLATATLPALALGVEPASANIMKHKPIKSGTLFEKELIGNVVIQGLFVAAMTIWAYWIGIGRQGYQTGQAMAFCVLAFSQMMRSFNERSNTEPIWVRAEGYNLWLVVAFGMSVFLMGIIFLVPSLKDAFGLVQIGQEEWGIVLGLAFLSIVQIESVKLIKKMKHKCYKVHI